MKKVAEYRPHAEECRDLARSANADHRAQLLGMAETWDQLAEHRADKLRKLGIPEDQDHGQALEGE